MPSTLSEQLTSLALAVNANDAVAHLALAWRATAGVYKVELVDITEEVSETFLSYARELSDALAAGAVVPYDPEWPLKEHEYFELARADVPGGNLFDDLSDFQNLDTFSKKRLVKPRLYVACVQTAHGNAFFGKRMAYLKVLGQSRSVFAAVWDGSTFDALDDSVATFSRSFDWVLWSEHLYVWDGGGFHAEFRDSAALLRAVQEHVEVITASLAIRNAAKLVDRCRANVQMASKLKRIAEQGLHTQPIEALKKYAEDYNIAVQWDGDALVFDDTFEGQWAVLKLLDEDRTEGPVSHRKYESAAKRLV